MIPPPRPPAPRSPWHCPLTVPRTVSTYPLQLTRAQYAFRPRLQLLGRVGGDCVAIARGAGGHSSAESRWDAVERMRLMMPLQADADMEFWLDSLLPRVVQLATTSMQYREKAAYRRT